MKGFYEQAVLPEPFTILGRDLKPFSFGHYTILRRFNVGIVSDTVADRSKEDLIFAVFICSHTFQECIDLLYTKSWMQDVEQWALPFQEYEIDWNKTFLIFDRYIKTHTTLPPIKKVGGDSSNLESNAEWFEVVQKTLRGKCGLTRDQVLNMCFAEAMYEYLSYMEQQGAIVIRSDQSMTNHERAKAALKKEKELNG